MNGVRFRFFGGGHKLPITGHIYLRWVDQENKWRISSWSRREGHYETVEGDPNKEAGAARLISAIHDFIGAWAKMQQEAIDKHSKWSSHYQPKQALQRPGFRAVKADVHWHHYEKETRDEIDDIHKDVLASLVNLKVRGWIETIPDDWFVFPEFTFPHPWRK